MKELSSGLIIGTSIGLVIGVLLAVLGVFCFRVHKKRSLIGSSSSRRSATIPIRANGVDACTVLSDSSVATESPRRTVDSGISLWLGGLRRPSVLSASGILEYSYKYVISNPIDICKMFHLLMCKHHCPYVLLFCCIALTKFLNVCLLIHEQGSAESNL